MVLTRQQVVNKHTIVGHRGVMPDHSFNFVADIPTAFHSHYFNLFWDQTIDDALGPELGTVIRTNAARECGYDLLASLASRLQVSGPSDIFALTQSVLHLIGQGQLTFEVNERGGTVVGDHLHFGVGWNRRHSYIRRRHPADAVAAGFAAAAIELAHGLPRDSVRCREIECVALDASRCRFTAEVTEPGPLAGPMTRQQVSQAIGFVQNGLYEDRIGELRLQLHEHLSGLNGDDRGLIEQFGLFLSELPTTYYNRASYDALRHLSRTAPELVPVLHALLRQAGNTCVFHTFGAIMTSPVWESIAGRPTGEPTQTLAACIAVARALGLGQWCIDEYDPGSRLVLRTSATYEAAYYVHREGRSSVPQCFFFQGASAGIMQLVEQVQWKDRPMFDETMYEDLARTAPSWRAEETLCVTKGDPCCEVVVTRQNA